MRSTAYQAAAIGLCLLCGTGALQAVVLNPMQPPSISISAFMKYKREQPIVRADAQWTLTAAGDIMLSRYVAAIVDRESVDYPYDDIRGITRGADIMFANLENPVGAGTRTPYNGFRFRAEPRMLEGLSAAGFDIFSIANNHMSDAGQQGIAITTELLKNAGFAFSGAGENQEEARAPAIIDVGEKKVAFLAYGDPRFSNQVHFATDTRAGIALATAEEMKADVRKARETADVVIISLHAGIEYLEEPDSKQQALLHAAADAGADIVLGHHPHVIQPLEKRGDSWIIDSLGNLVFDQMWSDETRLGMMLQFMFDGNVVKEIEAIPIQIFDFAQARIATGNAKDAALKRLQHDTAQATVVRWIGTESGAVLSERAMPLQQKQISGFTIEKTLRDNLNPNRRGETYELTEGKLTVKEQDVTLWKSPADWWVQDVHIADIDGDHSRELILSVWKRGNYGPSKPFWVEENDPSIRNHVFVYAFKNGNLQPVWQSSNLLRPNCEITFADLNGDEQEELIALEGEYTADARCEATTIGIWQWENWGFYNQWGSNPGTYWNLRTERVGSGSQIVVNGQNQL